jgi:hypothetical protein
MEFSFLVPAELHIATIYSCFEWDSNRRFQCCRILFNGINGNTERKQRWRESTHEQSEYQGDILYSNLIVNNNFVDPLFMSYLIEK